MGSLSDLYEPRSFEDTGGPGCGQQGHEDSCLCDVDLTAHPVPPNATVDLRGCGYAKIATQVAGRPRSGRELVDWASEYLGAFEAVYGSGKAEALEELRDEYARLRHQGGAWNLRAAGNVVRSLLGLGLRLQTIADFLDERIVRVVAYLHREPERRAELTSAFLLAEQMLHDGVATHAAVARATGLERRAVGKFADMAGIKSVAAKQRGEGGGLRYTAEEYARILELRAAGRTYAAIAEAVGGNAWGVRGVIARAAAHPRVAS